MCLTDFAAAFPSTAISWLLRVLVLTQVHPGVVGFFEALYSDNLGTVCFGGKRHRAIRLLRGVRQGDPSSMLLFALALDPCI
eukprot:4220448-Pyramimonas_sp.AAC.1